MAHFKISGFSRPHRPPSAGQDQMQGSYLGPSYDDEAIAATLLECGAQFRRLPENEFIVECARLLADGATVAWFQGRMEFGPRALGARSILADPRNATMQRELNLKVKFRESFRPFAPAVLAEEAGRWFDLHTASPYMLIVADVVPAHRLPSAPAQGMGRLRELRSTIPAVTHVDYSARVQTVHRDTNERFHRLLEEFFCRTGCPMLVNTSFNVRGEPIVESPSDAYRCFMGSGVDYLAIGNILVAKHAQPRRAEPEYAQQFVPD
jgi:carbamoyltransferase